MLAAEHKSRGDSFNTNATNGAGPYTQNYRNSKQDEFGNLKNTDSNDPMHNLKSEQKGIFADNYQRE